MKNNNRKIYQLKQISINSLFIFLYSISNTSNLLAQTSVKGSNNIKQAATNSATKPVATKATPIANSPKPEVKNELTPEKELLNVGMNSLFRNAEMMDINSASSQIQARQNILNEVFSYIQTKSKKLNITQQSPVSHLVYALIADLFKQIAIREVLVGSKDTEITGKLAHQVAEEASILALRTFNSNNPFYYDSPYLTNNKSVNDRAKTIFTSFLSYLQIKEDNQKLTLSFEPYFDRSTYKVFESDAHFEFQANKITFYTCNAKNALMINDVFAIFDVYLKEFNLMMFQLFNVKMNFVDFAFRNITKQNFDVATTCITDSGRTNKTVINHYLDGKVIKKRYLNGIEVTDIVKP